MDEVFRYQQLRQSQRLFDEQKRSIGLPLYPDGDYSPLANDLIDINKGSDDEARWPAGWKNTAAAAKVHRGPGRSAARDPRGVRLAQVQGEADNARMTSELSSRH